MGNPTDAAAESAAQLAARLASNAVESLPDGALVEKLALAKSEGRRLRVKLGIDPTAPDIHLGHAVVLCKLREFQDAGHRVVLIIGDYTARVGDPSGRSALRPILSVREIEENADTFQEQALRILAHDPELLEVRHNSEWLDMPMADLLALARTTTAAQLLEREDFAKRWSAGTPISVLELLYPLLQGYDSIAVQADIELGGTDQKFNLLLGRDIQRAYGQPAQAILTMPLLVGVEGKRKMSKSLGNQIGITEPPEEIYGKTMSIPDTAIGEYRRLLLDPLESRPAQSPPGSPSDARGAPDVGSGDGAEAEGAPSGITARDAKRSLAHGLVRWLYSEQDADAAQRHFERVFGRGEVPAEVPVALFQGNGGLVHLPGLIAEEFGLSRSQARRVIDEGGVTLGEEQLKEGEYDVPVERLEGQVLKVGKRRFRRLQAR